MPVFVEDRDKLLVGGCLRWNGTEMVILKLPQPKLFKLNHPIYIYTGYITKIHKQSNDNPISSHISLYKDIAQTLSTRDCFFPMQKMGQLWDSMAPARYFCCFIHYIGISTTYARVHLVNQPLAIRCPPCSISPSPYGILRESWNHQLSSRSHEISCSHHCFLGKYLIISSFINEISICLKVKSISMLHWLVVWNMFFHILGIIIPTD